MIKKRNALVYAASARLGARAPTPAWAPENFLLLDPEQPTKDANELLREQGRMAEPGAMNHNCPICGLTMNWELFKVHALPCYKRWRKVKLDIIHRTFRGGAVSTNVDVPSASASAGSLEGSV